nr:class I SAM-dependent methyltransferase [Lachnospiraceae bacterium]
MSDNNICKICGSTSGTIVHSRCRRVNDGRSFQYLACEDCGTLQLNETVDDIGSYYAQGYGAHSVDPDAAEVKPDLKKEALMRFIVAARPLRKISYLQRKIPGLLLLCGTRVYKDKKILDVGCGNGRWLYDLHKCGYNKLTGCDLFAQKSYPGIDFRRTDIFGIDNEKFDLITFHHSFEHMENPIDVLGKARELLDDDGMLMIRIPVWKSRAWEMYGPDWYQLDPPYHFYLYTEKSLAYMCDKTGLRITETLYDSTPAQFCISDRYNKTDLSYNEVSAPIDRNEMENYRALAYRV